MPTSVRLDPETERLLDRLVAAGQSRSAVIRDAIRRLVPTRPLGARARSFAARVRDSIGILTNGDPELSTDTGARFRTLLQDRRVREARSPEPARPPRRRLPTRGRRDPG